MLSHKRTIMTIFQLFLKIEDEEGDNGSQEQEDKISYILAFLRDGDGFAEVQDKDDGGDATSQRWFGTMHRIKNQVLWICRKVKKYSRLFINCLPRMQAEMQEADDGDEDLARIEHAQ